MGCLSGSVGHLHGDSTHLLTSEFLLQAFDMVSLQLLEQGTDLGGGGEVCIRGVQ